MVWTLWTRFRTTATLGTPMATTTAGCLSVPSWLRRARSAWPAPGPATKQFTVNLTNASDAVDGDMEETRRWLGAELIRILFPVFLEIYSVSAGPGVRHAAL